MKNNIIELISIQDSAKILNWAKSLTDEDRYASLEILKNLKPDSIINEPKPEQYNSDYYDKYRLISDIITYMMVCCVRSKKDLVLTISDQAWNKKDTVIHVYLRSPGFGMELLGDYFDLYPPDYLDEIVKENSKSRQQNNNFNILWQLYRHGWVKFDEEIFVRSLFIIPMFERKTMEDVRFLSVNPGAIDKVLIQFYKYEIPILDISKWQRKVGFYCKKCTEYWDEVFAELFSLGLLKDRAIIRNLLSTLTYNWKKGHLDWHIRLLKLLKATEEEYLINQDYLLAALSSTSDSVCNFVVNTVDSIYREKDFDAETFLRNLPGLLLKDKSNKAILKALNIVSYLLKNNPQYRVFTEMLSSALVQPDSDIQEKTALILKQYLSDEDLKQAVEPFALSLKQKARDILLIENIKAENNTCSVLNNYQFEYPSVWEDFLFHIGKTLGSLDVADIDIMYNAFVLLQDRFPENYISQLKPFVKKAKKAFSDKELQVYISEFFESWLSPGGKYIITDSIFVKYGKNPNPFMRNRNKWVLNMLKRGCKLPILSTPTHFPFYVHPSILVSRLGEYEKAGEDVRMEDLIVACNRILKTEVSEDVKNEAGRLKGYYAGAVHYLLGMTDEIIFEKDTLPLWTQITRTKNPDGIFSEFKRSNAKDYPTVVEPFFISYKIHREYSSSKEYHWDYMDLDDLWNSPYSRVKNKDYFPYLFFYTVYNSFEYNSKDGFRYWLSLIPHYCDAFLLHNLPNTASGNEVEESEYCLFPLQFIIENQIQVHHSGWLYIAFCLIFEKKVSRTLAAEYIDMSFDSGFINEDYLSESIADMIMNKLAPVNRLIEYFDRISPEYILNFRLRIIEKCIHKANKNNLPVNFKKLVIYYREICSLTKTNTDPNIDEKIKSLKK